MHYFTTYFDKNYLSRGLVMYDSLKENCTGFKLYILCLDDFTLQYFKTKASDYPEITTLSVIEIEEADKELFSCKGNRSTIEYYFTLSPCLPLYLIKKYALPHICSLDADILFLDSPDQLFKNLDKYSIIITPHKFSKELEELNKYGRYNVSFQVFKSDQTGIECLEKWRKQCIDWCGDHYDEKNDRFADQKYLDEWPSLYQDKVKVLDDQASGIAPWNLNNYIITKRKENFYSNGDRIIFYHFHHFKIYSKNWGSNGFNLYKAKKQNAVDDLYLLYWKKLLGYNRKLFISQDISTRVLQHDNKWSKIANENVVYFNLKNIKIFHVKFSTLNRVLKRVLIKLDV